MTILLTLEIEGVNLGPFSLYSNTDGYTNPFATNITKDELEAGYTFTNVPPNTTIIQVKSLGNCSNSINIVLENTTTTSTSSSSSTSSTTSTSSSTSTSTSSSSTTTSTTTATPVMDAWEYNISFYDCNDCNSLLGQMSISNSEPLTIGKWYIFIEDYKMYVESFIGMTAQSPLNILDSSKQDTCEAVICYTSTTSTTTTAVIADCTIIGTVQEI